jgi:zona occludens toxin (predicted ATPase)
LRVIHKVCAVLVLLSTGLLVGAGTMTGKVDQASLQSALYKTGYFVFLVVLVVAVLLSMRVALLQRNLVKQSHLTVSPPGVRTSQSTNIFQRTHTDHS